MKKKTKIALSICIPILAAIILYVGLLLSILLDPTDYRWEFDQDYTEVKTLMIIEIKDLWRESQLQTNEFDVLLEIDVSQAKTVFEDVKNLHFHRYGPNLDTPRGKAILIVFNNDEYDLITCWAPQHNIYDERLGEISDTGYGAWLYCDETQFNELLNKYLEQA